MATNYESSSAPGANFCDSIEEGEEDAGSTYTEENYCHCCGVKTAKARLHYGGITCYPCRSFFRRATVSEKKKKCKKGGHCQVKFDDRKSCNPCRYQECLRNGMRPHLVLSEDQIHERFRNLPRKEKRDFSPEKRLTTNESTSNEFTETTLENRHHIKNSDTLVHENFSVDLMRYNSAFDESSCLANDDSVFQVSQKPAYDNWDLSHHRPSVLNKKFRINDENNYLTPLRQNCSLDEELPCHRPASIRRQKSVIMLAKTKVTHQDEFQDFFDTIEEDDEICFTIDELKNDEQKCNSDLEAFLQDRSFVEFSLEKGINEVDEVDKMLEATLDSIDQKVLENLDTIEEKNYIQFMGQKFRSKWCEVNISAELNRDYIGWCRKHGPSSQEMFSVVSRAMSERFSRMVETTNEFQDLDIHDKFLLLKSNLKYADTLTMIRKLSFLNPKDDFFSSWGAEDRLLWNESGMNPPLPNIQKNMPFDLKLKQQFISLLLDCKLPILSDQHVFSLLVAIVIFSSGDIQLIERHTINNIHEEYLTMLGQYVRQREEEAENIIGRLRVVLSIIPKLSQLFIKMNIVRLN